MATMPTEMQVQLKLVDESGREAGAARYVTLTRWTEACPFGPTVGQMRDLIRKRNQNGLEAHRVVKKIGKQWTVDVVQFGVWWRMRAG